VGHGGEGGGRSPSTRIGEGVRTRRKKKGITGNFVGGRETQQQKKRGDIPDERGSGYQYRFSTRKKS